MTVKTFAQAAPPPDDFIEARLSGYYQLAVAANANTGNEAKEAGDEYAEDFRFLRHAPFSEIGHVVASFSSDPETGGMRVHQLNITRFLLRAVHPDDRTRLAVLLDDQARVVTTEQITGLTMHLVEAYSGKALTP